MLSRTRALNRIFVVLYRNALIEGFDMNMFKTVTSQLIMKSRRL